MKIEKGVRSVRIGLELEQKLELWIRGNGRKKANKINEIESSVVCISC
jgi:predicted DNA-binding protein